MALNTSIALQARGVKLDNPIDVQAKIMNLRDLTAQGQMRDMQMQEYQRAREGERTLADIYRTAGVGADGQPNHDAIVRQMAERGEGGKIGGYLKQAADAGKARADVAYTTAKTGKTDTENTGLAQAQRYTAITQSLQQLGGVNSPQDMELWMAHGVRTGALTTQKAEAATLAMRQNPESWAQLKDQLQRTGQSIQQQREENTPKLQTVALGGRDEIVDLNSRTTKTPAGSSFQRTQTPDSIASNARIAAEGAANRGVTVRGQNMTDARARDGAQGGNAGDDPTQAAMTKRFGKPEVGRRWKLDGSQEPIPGGSVDLKLMAGDMGKGSVNDVVASLRDMYDQLDTDGGITNPDKGSVRNLAAGVASSGPGQAAGRLFGTKNQSLRNTVAQQRPLLLQAIMKATGMSAKQMDSNAELKLYLATATDPTLDVAANRRALGMIETLYGKPGGGGAENPIAPKPSGAPVPGARPPLSAFQR